MDLNHLHIFVKVAQLGSFTQAASALGLERSAVSRRVAALEKDLGLPLLLRSTRQVLMTTAGQRLLQQVAPLLQQVEVAVHQLPERSPEPAGELRITAPLDLGMRLLPPVLASLTARYEALQPVVELTNRVVDLEREGFDVALRVSLSERRDSALRSRRLGEISNQLYASAAYLERNGTPTSLEQLAGHVRVALSTAGHIEGLPPMRRVQVNDMLMAAELVRASAGLALLPDFLGADDLVQVLPDTCFGVFGLFLMLPSTGALPPKTTAFRDALVAHMKATPLQHARP